MSSSGPTKSTAMAQPSSSSAAVAKREEDWADFPDDPFSASTKPSPYPLHSENMAASSSNDSLAAWAKTTRFNVLNHFSQVTNVARNGAHTLLSSPIFQPNDGVGDEVDSSESRANGHRYNRASLASLATSFLQHGPVGPLGPSDPSWKHSELAKKSGTGEYDSARVYLAKWAKLVAEEGEVNRLQEQESRARNQQQARMTTSAALEDSEVGSFEVWDLLPCIDKPDATRVKDGEISQQAWSALFDDTGRPTVPFNQMRQLVFQHGFGRGGQSTTGTRWEQLDPRAECWSFLLGAQRWRMEEDCQDRKRGWDAKQEEYWDIKTQMISRCSGTAVDAVDDAAFWKEQRHRVNVDCLRVDKKLPLFRDKSNMQTRYGSSDESTTEGKNELSNMHEQRLQDVLLTYVMYDQRKAQGKQGDSPTDSSGGESREADLLGGYVQGMSDLCAPLYSVCHGDEAKTFWLFVGLMDRIRSNFYSDQSGMKMQLLSLQKLIAVMDPNLYAHLERADSLNLFFCFRWLLVFFKREFGFPDILMLWEAMFAASIESDGKEDSPIQGSSPFSPYKGLSNHFQLFVAFAILEHHRDVLIKYLHNFDELLQYMNGLSGQIDIDATIAQAEVLCVSLCALVEQKEHPDESQASVNLPTIDEDLRALILPSSVPKLHFPQA